MTYRKPDGAERKFMCQAAIFYQTRAERYYGQAADAPFRATEVCDEYGVDTRAIETMIMWLSRCHKSGLITDRQTGIPLTEIGSREFIEALVERVARREGFGDLLAGGTHSAAEVLGADAKALIKDYMTGTGENDIYGPRLYLTTGIFYALEPRMPIHQLHEISVPIMMWAAKVMGMDDVFVTSDVIRAMARRFMGSEEAADFSTYDGKALAAATIQNREYAKESLILCDLTWPIFFAGDTESHVGDPGMDSQVFSAVTGTDMDEEGMYRVGERVMNMQRAILVREGHAGREHDVIDEYNFTSPLKGDFGNPSCTVPGKDGQPFSRLGAVVDRGEFERMKSEFYRLRGWDVSTGLQTVQALEPLGLEDVARDLQQEGLAI
jgi:aldehyde:ferredoxin oxidoreductase